MKRGFRGPKFLFIIPFALLGIAAFTLAVVVHVSTVSFWQALGLLVLSKILFSGFRGAHWGRHQWKNRMMQRWDNMTPEEKEKFRGEWERRCGRRFGRSFEEQKTTVPGE
jgi:Ca2+/H+ antiporter, TMEM165/GDT1 family